MHAVDDTFTKPTDFLPTLETFAKPKLSGASGDGLIQSVKSKMQAVLKENEKEKEKETKENKKRGAGLPKRLERILQSEIDHYDPGPPILTELIEILVDYSVAHLDHTAEKEGIRSESKSTGHATKANASTTGPQKEAAGAGSELHRPASRELGSKERSLKWMSKENAYQAEQCQRLQRCAHLYSQVLFANAEWDSNMIEDQNCFEKLYAFIVKVVKLCVVDRWPREPGEARPKTGTQTSARPGSIVEEELGRLFRSSIFNTRARRRERNQNNKFREESNNNEEERFKMEDSGGKGGRGGQDPSTNTSGSTKGTSSSIDAIIARFRQCATSRRSRPSKCGKEGMQYAASARSPMIAALLPSPREKIMEVNTFCYNQIGLSPRKGQGSDMMWKTLPETPRRSPKKKDAEIMEKPFENTWALRSGRSRIIHDGQTWTQTAMASSGSKQLGSTVGSVSSNKN